MSRLRCVAFAIATVSCGEPAVGRQPDRIPPPAVATIEIDTTAIRLRDEQRAADSSAAVRELVRLKRKFRFDADAIEGGGWYEHRNQTVDNSWDRTYLEVHVAHDGRTYLSSHYYGDDWIFHDRLVVRIGDNRLESDAIPSFDKSAVRHNSGGSVWESLHLTGGRDNGILEAIAKDSTSAILVRLAGDRSQRDIVLSKRDHEAIRDGYALGRLLKQWPQP